MFWYVLINAELHLTHWDLSKKVTHYWLVVSPLPSPHTHLTLSLTVNTTTQPPPHPQKYLMQIGSNVDIWYFIFVSLNKHIVQTVELVILDAMACL